MIFSNEVFFTSMTLPSRRLRPMLTFIMVNSFSVFLSSFAFYSYQSDQSDRKYTEEGFDPASGFSPDLNGIPLEIEEAVDLHLTDKNPTAIKDKQSNNHDEMQEDAQNDAQKDEKNVSSEKATEGITITAQLTLDEDGITVSVMGQTSQDQVKPHIHTATQQNHTRCTQLR